MRGWRSLSRDVAGAALVEFTVVAAVFLFALFAAIEGGFLGIWWTQTEKAVEAASRLLVVRPPLVADVPELRAKNPALDTTTIRFGELCTGVGGGTPCAPVPTRSCTIEVATAATTCADAAAATAVLDRMRRISPFALVPGNPGTITVTYADAGVGFVGGPYVPAVTVRADGLRYTFFAIAGLAPLLGGSDATGVTLPPITVTLVGEDLNVGTGG